MGFMNNFFIRVPLLNSFKLPFNPKGTPYDKCFLPAFTAFLENQISALFLMQNLQVITKQHFAQYEKEFLKKSK